MTDKPNLTRVWAKTAPGGNVVDPDTVTAGKFTAGWQAEVPPFEYFNFIQKQVTEGLAHINEQGIAVWDTNTVYPVGGLAKGSDGNVYRALLSQSTNDPVTDGGTNWIDWEVSNRVIRVISIAAIEALTPVANYQVSLSGSTGGIFEFSTSDLATEVAVDTAKYTHIAPSSDATGSSGAWVRVPSDLLSLDSVAESIFGKAAFDGYKINISAWHEGAAALLDPKGGGLFIANSSVAKSLHNGGTVISPTVPAVSAQSGADESERIANFLNAVGETDGSGSGCYLRVSKERLMASDWGAKIGVDCVTSINAGIANGAFAFDGMYQAEDVVLIPSDADVQGYGWTTGIKCTHSDNGMMMVDSGGHIVADRVEAVRDFKLSNFLVDGNSQAAIGGYFLGFQNSRIDHIKFVNCLSHGHKVEGNGTWVGGGVYYNLWTGVYARSNGGRGFYFERNGRAVNTNTFIAGDASFNGKEGFRGNTLFGGVFECTTEQNNQNTDGSETDYESYLSGCANIRYTALFLENTTSSAAQKGFAFDDCNGCSLTQGSHSGVLEGLSGSTDISAYFVGNNAGSEDQSASRQQKRTTNGNGRDIFSFGRKCTIEPTVIIDGEEGRPFKINSFNTDGDGFFVSATVQALNYDGTTKSSATDYYVQSRLVG